MKSTSYAWLLTVCAILSFSGCENPSIDTTTSNNPNLAILTVSTGVLSPAFDSNTTNYAVSVDNSTTSITVTGTPADSKAIVSANSGISQTLNVGINTIIISVVAEDEKTIKNYLISVTRAGTSNADLSALMVSEGVLSPVFNPLLTTYIVNVPYTTEQIQVTGTKSDLTATVSANNTIIQNLNVGANEINIIVTAQDGITIKKYSVTVIREGSSNADLSSLSLSTGLLYPAFNPAITSYTVTLPSSIEQITVTGIKADNNSEVSTNNGIAQDLRLGSNTIDICVTAQDGSTYKHYVLTVVRTPSNNADLSALSVNTGTLSPVFSTQTFAYTVNVPFDISEICLTGYAADANATLSSNNGLFHRLNTGTNIFSISVTAQDGSTRREYIVTVLRESLNTDLAELLVSDGILKPTFMSSITEYTVNVPNTTSSIVIAGTVSDQSSSVSANNGVSENLIVGDNMIILTVTGRDGITVKHYHVRVNRLFSLEMVSVPSGSFQRDANASNTSTVSSFRISEKEITRSEFSSIFGVDPSDTLRSTGISDPVQSATWYHAIAFCNKLSIAEGLSPVYSVSDIDFSKLEYSAIPKNYDEKWDDVIATWTNTGYRLPTDAEWTWAAMGATSDRSNGYSGSGINRTGITKGYAGSVESGGLQVNIGDYAWYVTNSDDSTHPVGTAGLDGGKNELGIYDMSGNVWEWIWDWDYGVTVPPEGVQTDFRGPPIGSNRVRRGGSWAFASTSCSIASRGKTQPSTSTSNIGFRVVQR